MKVIKDWYKATEDVARAFTKKYFKTEVYGEDTFWAGGEIGGVYCVSDMFIGLDRMIEALELKATWERLSDYYLAEVEHATENPGEPMYTNFKDFIKYGWIKVK